MKLTDSALYLSLVRATLERKILPELQSPDAKGAAAMVMNVLNELSRREASLPQVMAEVDSEGEKIANEMRARLQQREAGGHAATGSGFNDRVLHFTALSEQIAGLAKGLSLQGGDNGELLRRAAVWEGEAHIAFLAVAVAENKREAAVDPLPREALQAFLQTVHPAGKKLQVTSINRVAGGFGKQTYMVDVDDGSGQAQTLVVRKNEKIKVLFHSTANLEREFHLLKVVRATGYPAPNPLWFGKNVPGIDADFMVVEKLPGRMIGALLDGADSKIPESQMLLLADLLAKLHAIDLDAFASLTPEFEEPSLLTETIERCTRRTMAGWREAAEQHGYLPSPLIDYLFNWLADNVPKDSRRPVLAHGDFGSHNILMENDRVTAVLDWEGSMFAAPEMDLAYALPLVSKHVAWDKFLAHYIACGGSQPDPHSMNYYVTFLALRVVLVGNVHMRNLQAGINTDIRYSMFELGLNTYFMQQAIASTMPP